MPKVDPKTRTARFFMAQYGKATLRAAVEAAARRERTNVLPGLADYCRVPVDLDAITTAKKITLVPDASVPESVDADLWARDTGYFLRTAVGGSKLRRRFSVAHEIGHTLFLKGGQHTIGVLSSKEVETEERICDMFASALLMPYDALKGMLRNITVETPGAIFGVLEATARRMQVSMPALVSRMTEVDVQSSVPLMTLCLRWFANLRTGDSPCLRVDICSSYGALRDTRTWHNKSASGLNLRSADSLFAAWLAQCGLTGDPTGGKYGLDNSQLIRPEDGRIKWVEESLFFDIREKGKWRRRQMPMRTASCLYAARGWGRTLAYVIALLTPVDARA